MKEFAIRENHLFVKAYAKGKRCVTDTVSVFVLRDFKAARLKKENPKKEFLNRIGFTASTKVGHAVVRNRCKRIMRAAYRSLTAEQPIKTGCLIVIAARGAAVSASSADVRRDLAKAFRKLGLIGETRVLRPAAGPAADEAKPDGSSLPKSDDRTDP